MSWFDAALMMYKLAVGVGVGGGGGGASASASASVPIIKEKPSPTRGKMMTSDCQSGRVVCGRNGPWSWGRPRLSCIHFDKDEPAWRQSPTQWGVSAGGETGHSIFQLWFFSLPPSYFTYPRVLPPRPLPLPLRLRLRLIFVLTI